MASFLGFPVGAMSAPAAQFGEFNKQRPLYARLFDKINPGGVTMSDADKQALFRQGLLGLAAGMASTSGQGTAGAIGNGLQSGLLAMNTGRADLADRRQREQMLARGMGDPAGLREFEAMTEGLSEEEKAQARRVRLGIEGRASSAGMGFETWTDANGVPRPARMDPRKGAYEIYYEEEGRWVPIGEATQGAPTQAVTGPSAGLLGSDMLPMYESLRPAVERAESGGNPNAVSPAGAMGRMQVMPGTARDPGFGISPARDNSDAELTRTGEQYLQAMLQKYGDPRAALAAYNWGPGNVDRALQQTGGDVDAMLQQAPQETRDYVPRVLGYAGQTAQAPAGLGRGRRKEDEAAAVTSAQQAAELGFLPERQRIETEAAINRARGTEEAKAQVEAQTNLPKSIQQADEAISTIHQLENHPGLSIITGMSGVVDPRNYLRGTSAQGAQTLVDQIQGQVFLQAFESLKGGGQITEVEGKKAEQAKARLNTAQSEDDYRSALQELREVIEAGRRRAIQQAQGVGRSAQPQGGQRLRYNPATGRLE